AARSIALLSYRNAATYNKTQQDNEEKLDHFRAISYQQYQGDKLVKRFNAYAYYTITKAFDTHNVGRTRGGIKDALLRVKARTLLIAISSDILFYPDEIRALQQYIPNSWYVEIDSLYGHDGFLIETEQLTKVIKHFLSEKHYET
ncbi:MAG: homoserine O-acetyltransferase, partial [Bacteroidales bacterium]